jgi:hypothetical protein
MSRKKDAGNDNLKVSYDMGIQSRGTFTTDMSAE